ncbi:hypothetical protein NQ152_12785 [Microbacterium sp. zg.B48]|nr:hypothetical protein [Microbacterium sp. zg.B48]MCR2764380.1 hypothetical protein [Microbacterium sp. zg.B48]
MSTDYDDDTFAADLRSLITQLNLPTTSSVALHGHGELAGHATNHGHDRIARFAFLSSLEPFLLQTPDNRAGVPPRPAPGWHW